MSSIQEALLLCTRATRLELATDPYTDRNILMALLQDSIPQVRLLAAQNENSPYLMLKSIHLSRKEPPIIAYAAGENLRTNPRFRKAESWTEAEAEAQ